MSNSVQVQFLKELYERQDREFREAFNKQYEENQRLYKRVEKEDQALLRFGSAMLERLCAHLVALDLEEMGLNDSYPNYKKRVAEFEPLYLQLLKSMRRNSAASYASPSDKNGNPKTPERLKRDEEVLKALALTFEKYDDKVVARIIYPELKAGRTDWDSFLAGIFRPILDARLKEVRSEAGR